MNIVAHDLKAPLKPDTGINQRYGVGGRTCQHKQLDYLRLIKNSTRAGSKFNYRLAGCKCH
jgi:hypothetical protein